MKHLFIVNPVCGKGISFERCSDGIVKTMNEMGITDYEIHVTTAPRDGYEYAKKRLKRASTSAFMPAVVTALFMRLLTHVPVTKLQRLQLSH